ncbi:MAG: MBL fold metallo-hydrolase [Saprospiraceae bacterium]|nr:MBL fold metallo-hydrolase [Saprospiraceae bacterium]
MSIVNRFTFNAFQENTYIIQDEGSKKAIIIDPGCHTVTEREEIMDHIEQKSLSIVAILNTHCHVDHVFGNAFLKRSFPDAPLCIHRGELPVLRTYPNFAAMYGLVGEPSPEPDQFLEGNEVFAFGDTTLQIFLTPGHSPASISFYNKEDQYIIGGDVLFYQSIGRTDLPGGNYDTLIKSINDHFLTLPDDTIVYSGHGPSTTIGAEKNQNPFLS